MALRLKQVKLNFIELMLVKVPQKPFSYYEKIISFFSVVEIWAFCKGTAPTGSVCGNVGSKLQVLEM